MSPDDNAVLFNLAEQVQTMVPVQPWGYAGRSPVPVEIFFDSTTSRPDRRWTVKYVCALTSTGTKRRWNFVYGATLEQALQRALAAGQPKERTS